MQVQELVPIKGKRSKRPRLSSPLSLTMATTSSSTTADCSGGDVTSDNMIISGDNTNFHRVMVNLSPEFRDDDEEEMANCLILLAKGRQSQTPSPQAAAAAAEVYQCKTCNKSFPSFQALGGHRASHKKPLKPIVAVDGKKPLREKQESSYESTILSLQMPGRVFENKKIRVHECSICGAEFASGQALGGHMRRHRQLPPPPAVAGSGGHGGESQEAKRPRNLLPLDLNLPAPEEYHDHHSDSNYAFVTKERVIVVSASPLVDCHI